MINEYLLVHKSILPDYFDLVIKCRELIENEKKSVSDACKIVNISRSTYYKYKDYVFKQNVSTNQVAILAIRMQDIKGLLGKVLNEISSSFGNILTLNQEMPINGIAYITLSIDISNLSKSVKELMKILSSIEGVKLVELLALE